MCLFSMGSFKGIVLSVIAAKDERATLRSSGLEAFSIGSPRGWIEFMRTKVSFRGNLGSKP
jgi:hypothetical protein